MNKLPWIISAILLIIGACNSPEQTNRTEENADTAQRIVDQAIARHGGDLYRDIRVSFDFRDRHYKAARKGWQFTYERIFSDSAGHRIHDVFNNDGLTRTVDDQPFELTEKQSSAYANSVNSVIYFALLPFFLNDPAVIKEYLGETTLRGEPYHKIGVTFRQEGGGKDHEDEYVYWFHRDRLTMDFLAYNFLVDGGGARFREAYNSREINGVRFQDYINYKPKEPNMNVKEFDALLENDGLEELSRIELENVEVISSN